MPVYEYACKGCGHEFEREQRITDKPVKKCPECGAMKAKRLISRTSFVLKGGGWYNDLYASPKPAGGKEESGGESSESKEAPKKEASEGAKDKPGPGKKGSKGASGKGSGGDGGASGKASKAAR